MTNPASEVEPNTMADLFADAAVVQSVLHLGDTAIQLPHQGTVVLPDSVIPDRALALVAGLDTYGD